MTGFNAEFTGGQKKKSQMRLLSIINLFPKREETLKSQDLTGAWWVRLTAALTYSEEHHHAQHGQQGGDDHAEERRQFPGLLLVGSPLPGAPRPLLRGLAGLRAPPLRLIDAGGEAVVEKRSPLGHGEAWLWTSLAPSWSTREATGSHGSEASLQPRASDHNLGFSH